MKKDLIVFIVILGYCICQPIDFSAQFELSRPSLSGIVSGTLYYSRTYLSTRLTYASGYEEITHYDPKNPNDLFTYKKCTSKCDITPNDPSIQLPTYYYVTGDSCAKVSINAPFGSCFVCDKSLTSSSDVESVCVKDTVSYTPVRISLRDGTKIDVKNVATSGITATTFAPPNTWGCKLNCNNQIDIVMVVDMSGSIDGNYIPSGRSARDDGEWKDVRTFAAGFVAGFDIAPDKVNMGLVQFGYNARRILPTIISNETQFTEVIAGLTKCSPDGECDENQPTYTGTGMLEGAFLLLDNSGARALRSKVPKLIAIITDGVDTQPDNPFEWPLQSGLEWKNEPTFEWIDYIHDKGIKVIAIGVGDDINLAFLDRLASIGPNNTRLSYLVSTFTGLTQGSIISQLGSLVCTASGTASTGCSKDCKGLCACGVCECPNICDDSNACTNGICNATRNLAGGCLFDKVDCDDNNACTLDTCSILDGCLHPILDCNVTDKCVVRDCNPKIGCTSTPLICDDKNACTIDKCDRNFGCVYTNVSEDFCDDGDPCTIDTCDISTGCRSTPVNCTPADSCFVSTCNPKSGSCTPIKNICNDDNPCTTTISPGKFAPIDCTGGDKCISPFCDLTSTAADGCTRAPVDCDDGNACSDDKCDSATGCSHTPTNCDDNNACTIDTCDKDSGCNHTAIVCDDGNACTTDECDQTKGCVFSIKDCDDNNACTDDYCNSTTGCVNEYFNVTERCFNGDICQNWTCEPTIECKSTPVVCQNDFNDTCISVVCDSLNQLFCVPQPTQCNVSNDCEVSYCATDRGCYTEETDKCKLTKILGGTTAALLSIGAIIAIVIAAVVCAGGTTAASVAGYNFAFKGQFDNQSSIYEKSTINVQNPAYNRDSVFNTPPVKPVQPPGNPVQPPGNPPQ
jgi:hypothetical protein